jgi:hypothetical protein
MPAPLADRSLAKAVYRYAFFTPGGTVRPMPIRPEHRFFYPIDWAQLSAVIRFGRQAAARAAGGRTGGWSTTSEMVAAGTRRAAGGAMGGAGGSA